MAATGSNHLEAFPVWARELSAYDRGGGLTFAAPDMKADFGRALAGYDSFHGTTLARGLPRNPDSFAETVAPAGAGSSMPAEDRNSPVILKRWAQDPGVASIQIPLPDETERLDLIAAQPAAGNLPPGSDVTPATLTKLTAGLKRVQLQSLIADAAENQRPLTLKFLTQRK
jgi:hypothetical protein